MSRQYRNSPIVEAVCEFRFEPSATWDPTIPGLVFERVQTVFPKRRPIKSYEARFEAGSEGVRHEVLQGERSQFLSEDEKTLMQVGPHQLIVNRLRPYTKWEEFRAVIGNSLEAYMAIAEPKAFQRIGLRYINRIELPGESIDPGVFFNFHPFVGPELPQAFDSFFTGIQIPYNNGADLLRIQMSLAGPSAPGVVPILLDLDYFLGRSKAVSIGGESEWLEQAHGRIEQSFEGCIKDALRQQFEEETD